MPAQIYVVDLAAAASAPTLPTLPTASELLFGQIRQRLPPAIAVYSHFDIIWDHLTEMSGLFATPHTPCTVLYVVTMLIGC